MDLYESRIQLSGLYRKKVIWKLSGSSVENKLSAVSYTCNLSTSETEAGGWLPV